MRGKRWVCLLLAFLWAVQLFPLSAGAQAPEAEGRYMVRLRESARLMGEEDQPIRVVTRKEMRELMAQGLVEAYEEDQPVTLLGDVSPYYGNGQWNLAMIGAQAAYEKTPAGQGVRVGVLDSGIASHAGLPGTVEAGYDYVKEKPDGTDTYGHGTFVAGLIAGSGPDGYLGAAPQATLVPLKCFDGQDGRVSDVIEAVYGGVDDFHCDVLNLSLGFTAPSRFMEEAIRHAEEQGVTVVAAAGNGGAATPYYPAAYETVLGVGAVRSDGRVYERSNHHYGVSLTAPGVRVESLDRLGGTTTMSGTSFSTPHVTAAAAVLKSVLPALTPEEIRALLTENAADDPAGDGWDAWYGYGVLDLAASVEALLQDPRVTQTDPTPVPAPVTYRTCLRDGDCPLAPFEDLNPTSWYHDGVHFALQEGWMEGIGGGAFAPYEETSRAMIVTILWRMEGQPLPRQSAAFLDVPPGKWYSQAVSWAAENGVVDGYDAWSFGPGDPITREQMVTILYRYARLHGWAGTRTAVDRLDQFTDREAVATWALEPMIWAVDTGRITGMGDGTLLPKGTAKRAEAATLLMRFVEPQAPAA